MAKGGNKVTLTFVGDGDKLQRTFAKIGKQADDTDSRLSKVGKGVGAFVGKVGAGLATVGAFAGTLYNVGAGAGHLVAALAPAVGILAALPGVLAVAGVAAGTLKLALAGVGEAFGAALTGDAATFEKSLDGLSPKARSAARELRAFKPAIDDIRTSVQDTFFGKLDGQLDGLSAKFAGPLRSGMTGVSAELGNIASGVLAVVTSSKSVAVLNEVFESTRLALKGAGEGIPTLVGGLRELVRVGAGEAIGLGDAIGRATDRLGRFLAESSRSGKVNQWIADAKEVFSQLADVGGDVLGIVKGVFSAAGDAGGLGFIATLLEKIDTFVNSSKGQEFFEGLFDVLNQLGDLVGDALIVAFDVLAAALPYVLDAFAELTPTIKELLPEIGAMAKELLPVLGPLLVTVAKAVATVLPPVVSLAGALLTSMVPTLKLLALGLGLVVTVLASVIGWVADVGAAFVGWINKTVWAKDTWISAWDRIKQGFNTVKEWITGAITSLGGHIDKVQRYFGDMYSKVQGWLSKAGTTIAAFPGKVKSAFSGAKDLLVGIGEDMIRGLINGIGNMASAAVNKAKGVVSSAKEGAKKILGINSPSKEFEKIGVDSDRGYIVGMEKLQPQVAKAGRAVAADALAAASTPNVAAYQSTAPAPTNTGQTITLIISGTGVLEGLREVIRTRGGGNVQAYLGAA